MEARIDAARLDEFTFASRKRPEGMHHRLVECGRCGLAYANPAPRSEVLADAYAGAAYDTTEESAYAAASYAALLPGLLGRLPAQGAALDIGAGDGAFLRELLTAGFSDVVGVEASRAPVAAADASVRPHLRQSSFRASDFEAGQFRLVTCFQTLEHLAEPLEVCRGAAGLLRDGGALLVVAHDRSAPVNRILGRRSPIYDIEHMQLFCPRSLRGLLERAGLDEVTLRRISNRYPLRYWARLLGVPDRALARGAPIRGRVGGVAVTLAVGNLAAVGIKRA